MSNLLLYSTLLIAAACAVLLVYRYDMYNREPWPLLVATAAAGALVMAATGIWETATIEMLGPRSQSAAGLALVAATHEELARLAVVVPLAFALPRSFDDPMDGIIYGSVAGLGMALEESVMYMSMWKTAGPLLPPTELLRLFGHLVMGGITGFAIGMARMRLRRWRRVLAGCLAVSMALHFAWDWIALSAQVAGDVAWWQTLVAIAVVIIGILFYGLLVVVASDWSRQIFAPHRPRELWGWPFSLLSPKPLPIVEVGGLDEG